jgi:hypothetical protein
MHRREFKFVEKASRNAGLVGGYGHGIASLAQISNRLDAAGDWFPLIHGFDVLVGVLVDDSVSIQNNKFQFLAPVP